MDSLVPTRRYKSVRSLTSVQSLRPNTSIRQTEGTSRRTDKRTEILNLFCAVSILTRVNNGIEKQYKSRHNLDAAIDISRWHSAVHRVIVMPGAATKSNWQSRTNVRYLIARLFDCLATVCRRLLMQMLMSHVMTTKVCTTWRQNVVIKMADDNGAEQSTLNSYCCGCYKEASPTISIVCRCAIGCCVATVLVHLLLTDIR